jgi:ATP-dependent RNA helicase DeaD
MPSSSTTTFAALRPELQNALRNLGISEPTPIQAAAIPVLLDGADVVAQAQTGSGKTLAFALPLVERCDPRRAVTQALVLVPTRELAIQIGAVVGPLAASRGLRHTLLYGGRSLLPEQRALRHAQIVIGTPGRTLDHLRQGTLQLSEVRVLVLDEADEMLDRGFAPDVERILAQTPRERQTALFSATLPAWVAAIATKHLRAGWVTITAGEAPPAQIEHVVYDVSPGAKLEVLTALLDERDQAPVIVFGRTKYGVKKLAQRLGQLGYPAAALQGNLSQNARERVMTDFRAGVVPILVATNVAARGLDVHAVGQVINYELPESAELFTHRAGRTGRMGRHGEAVTLLTPDDAERWRQIERALGRRLARRPWGDSPSSGSADAPAPQPRPTRRRPRHSGPRGRQNGKLPHASGQRTRRRRVGSAA